MNGTTAWTVWQRIPDDGDAAGAESRGASRSAPVPPEHSGGRAHDAYGCVDWFDFEPERDQDARREGRGVPA